MRIFSLHSIPIYPVDTPTSAAMIARVSCGGKLLSFSDNSFSLDGLPCVASRFALPCSLRSSLLSRRNIADQTVGRLRGVSH